MANYVDLVNRLAPTTHHSGAAPDVVTIAAGWQASRLAGWQADRLVGRYVGRLAG